MSAVAVESYLQTSECAIVAAAALLTFDCCLTLGQEVEWLHGTKWTAVRIQFTISRYLPFVAIAMAIPSGSMIFLSLFGRPEHVPLASLSRGGTNTDYCGPLGVATTVVYYLCIVLAEAMLIVRTYAFWKRNKRILIGMCTFGAVCMVAAITVSETVASSATNSVYKALHCIGVESTLATGIQFICLILYELGMLVLNCIAFRRMTRQNPPGRFITTLYRDGVMYVATILMFSLLNAIVTLTTPVQYSSILNSLQMVIHSMLASRIFFNLRETTRREQSDSPSIPLSEFHAKPQVSSGFSSSMGTSNSSSRNDPKVAPENPRSTVDTLTLQVEGAVVI